MRINLLLISVRGLFPYLHIYCETAFHFMTWREDLVDIIPETEFCKKDLLVWLKNAQNCRQSLTL